MNGYDQHQQQYQQNHFQQPQFQQPQYQQNQFQQPNQHQFQQPNQYQQQPQFQQQFQYPQQQVIYTYDNNSEQNDLINLKDPLNMRLGFVRKVYCIILAQLILTAAICGLSMGSTEFRDFQAQNWGLLIFFAVSSILIMFALFCFKNICKKVPTNYILLFSFTICEAYMVSFICSSVSDQYIVMIAALLTIGVTLGITIYAMTTKEDITMKGATLWILAFALFFYGIIIWSFNGYQNVYLHAFYCILVIILYGFYLVYDTQLVMGGKQYELSMDDYIIGALIIYLDIIILFLRILELLQILVKK